MSMDVVGHKQHLLSIDIEASHMHHLSLGSYNLTDQHYCHLYPL